MKHRIDFTEILPTGTHYQQSAMVHGDLDDVQAYMDERNWVIESATVTQHIGSDDPGRLIPLDEWYQG